MKRYNYDLVNAGHMFIQKGTGTLTHVLVRVKGFRGFMVMLTILKSLIVNVVKFSDILLKISYSVCIMHLLHRLYSSVKFICCSKTDFCKFVNDFILFTIKMNSHTITALSTCFRSVCHDNTLPWKHDWQYRT